MSEPPHAALQRLTINGCHKLVSFAGEGLAAPNLTHLSITYCDKLEAFPSHMNTLLPSLHSLCIGACRKICKVPEGGLPPNLKELVLEGWFAASSSLPYHFAPLLLSKSGDFGVQPASRPHFAPTITHFILSKAGEDGRRKAAFLSLTTQNSRLLEKYAGRETAFLSVSTSIQDCRCLENTARRRVAAKLCMKIFQGHEEMGNY
ncbi:Putative disease resistance protein [Arachis hypogaea]|nr:Putative disease resistance protein [Arachis hypogaea]